MSKAFTKEDDSDTIIRLDDLPQSSQPNLVTPTGLADLQARLSASQASLASLRAKPANMGTPYDIAVAERDVRFLKGRIQRAILVNPKDYPAGIVAFGAEVDVVDENDNRQTFRIVSEDESNPSKGLITPFSPIGTALMGAEIGSEVEWRKPSGHVMLEILAIRFHS